MPVHDAPGNGTPAVAVALGVLAGEVVGPGAVAAGALEVAPGAGNSTQPAGTTDANSIPSVSAQRRTCSEYGARFRATAQLEQINLRTAGDS